MLSVPRLCVFISFSRHNGMMLPWALAPPVLLTSFWRNRLQELGAHSGAIYKLKYCPLQKSGSLLLVLSSRRELGIVYLIKYILKNPTPKLTPEPWQK